MEVGMEFHVAGEQTKQVISKKTYGSFWRDTQANRLADNINIMNIHKKLTLWNKYLKYICRTNIRESVILKFVNTLIAIVTAIVSENSFNQNLLIIAVHTTNNAVISTKTDLAEWWSLGQTE